MTSAPLLGEPLPVELMNTLWADRDGVHDALGSATETVAWLEAVGDRWGVPWVSIADDRELDTATDSIHRLRDAARALAARQTADARATAQSSMVDGQAIDIVNVLAGSAPAFPVLTWPTADEPSLVMVPERHAAATVPAELARATVTFFTSEARMDLRACQAPGCVLYFVKQHPRREWCTAACGNRARVARHYRRHRG